MPSLHLLVHSLHIQGALQANESNMEVRHPVSCLCAQGLTEMVALHDEKNTLGMTSAHLSLAGSIAHEIMLALPAQRQQ